MTDFTCETISPVHNLQSTITPEPSFARWFALPQQESLKAKRDGKVTVLLEPIPSESTKPVEAMGLAHEIIDYSLSVGWELTSIQAMPHATSTAVLGKPGVDVSFRIVVDTAYLYRVRTA